MVFQIFYDKNGGSWGLNLFSSDHQNFYHKFTQHLDYLAVYICTHVGIVANNRIKTKKKKKHREKYTIVDLA